MRIGSIIKAFLALFFLIASASFASANVMGGSQSSALTTLMGVDLSSLESGYACTGTACSYTPPCPATTGIDPECAYYHSKNLNTWRLAFTWSGIQPTLGGSLNSTYVGYMQNVVRQAGLVGACVILDMHNFGGYPGLGAIGSSGGPTRAQFAGVWGLISAQFAGMSGLCGYEPQNEPANMPTGAEWPADAQAAITAIRANDTNATIYIDGDSYATAANWLNNLSSPVACGYSSTSPLSDGNNGLKNLTDPNNKLVFAAHGYPDYNSSGSFPVYGSTVNTNCSTTVPNTQCTVGQDSFQCAQAMGNQLLGTALTTNVLVDNWTSWVNWCKTSLDPNGHHIKCWMGETAAPSDNANWNTVLNNGINFLQQNGILFTYWSAGPFASGTYGVYPSGLGTATIIDKPKMAVLTKYSNAYSPTTYQISGAARGTAGVAANFSISYNGYVAKAFTITLNDGGAGGTISPSSITCSVGFNCSGSFTVTESTSNVFAISATNSGGLTNPAAIGYSTIADQFSSAGLSASQISNVISLGRKIYAPYIGNAVTLRRGYDGATKSFGFTSNALNAPINSAAIFAWNGTGETDTLASTSVIVQYSNLFFADYGVSYTSNGNSLTRVAFNPTVGQYTVSSTGHYTFNAADIGSTVRINYTFPTYLVTAYDQSPAAQNLTIVSNGDSTPALVSDQPAFYLNCQNGAPCAYFNGSSRMDMTSPISGNTAQSILTVAAPTYHWGSGFMLGWDYNACGSGSSSCLYSTNFDTQGAGSTTSLNDQWTMSGNNSFSGSFGNGGGMRLYSQDAKFASIGQTWVYNTTGGGNTFLNGSQTGKNDTGSSPLYLGYSRNNATIGYQRSESGAAAGTWQGELSEMVVLSSNLSNSNTLAFQSDEDSFWGITNTSGVSWYLATLAQNTSTANAPPWAGTNQSGLAAGGGFSPYSCSPGINGGGKCPFNVGTTSAAQTYWKTRGMNIQRVPVQWEALQQNLCTGSTTLDATQLANLDAAVALITGAGLDAMIDLHNFGGYNYSYWSTCASPPDSGQWTATTTSTYFVSFWTQMAAHYASNPKVKFDLMNEPVGTTATASATIQQSAITAIRGQGFNNYIFTEFGSGYAACGDVSANGGPAFKTLTDSQSKLVLECHAYLEGCGNDTCGDYASQGAALSNLNSATTYAAANGIHLFWGEFNAGFNASMYSELKVAFDLMAANPTVWYGWTEFGAGPAWPEGYVGLIEPREFPTPYADRPQMRILNSAATGNTWPCAVYASGSSGACATANWPYDVKF